MVFADTPVAWASWSIVRDDAMTKPPLRLSTVTIHLALTARSRRKNRHAGLTPYCGTGSILFHTTETQVGKLAQGGVRLRSHQTTLPALPRQEEDDAMSPLAPRGNGDTAGGLSSAHDAPSEPGWDMEHKRTCSNGAYRYLHGARLRQVPEGQGVGLRTTGKGQSARHGHDGYRSGYYRAA